MGLASASPSETGSRFVGRGTELGAIIDALGPDSRAVFYCFAPGGVGKTSLLRRVASETTARGLPVLYVDARDLEPSPEAIEAAIVRATGCAVADAQAAIEAAGPCLLVLDTMEAITATLPWIFGELLSAIPRGVVTVLASRDPLEARWRTDLGWADRIHLLPLRNFGEDDSRVLLEGLGVTADHGEIFGFTLGHPLALTLVAESLRRTALPFTHLSTGDVVHELVGHFTRDIDQPERRRALEAACVVRVLTEPTLRALLEIDDSYRLFRWLRELSFFETVHDGLRPHEIVRRAVCADLRFRDPEWHDTLRDRAHRFFESQALLTDPRDEAPVLSRLYDISYLHSQNPIARRFFDWSSDRRLFAAQPAAHEIEPLQRIVEQHEGKDSARWLRYWFERQPECCHVIRDHTLSVVGYHCAPTLTAAGLEAHGRDPAVAGAAAAIAQHSPLRGNEVAVLTRYWLSTTEYQRVGPVQSLMWLHMVRSYALTQHMAYALCPFHDVGFWEPVFTYMGFVRVAAGDYVVDDHRYGIMMHDWRARPYGDWMKLMAQRESSFAPVMPADTPPPPAVLDRETFARAVKDALRHQADAHALGRNPLLNSQLVRGDLGSSASTEARIDRLRSCLDRACAALADAAGHDKHARAVVSAYGRGAPSQEAAADALGVPLSSFRRHLKRGVELVVERLWEEEIGTAR